MKRLIALLLLTASFVHADTTTTRVGLVKPTIGSSSWGGKTNSNWDIVDSSVCTLSGTNTMTGTYNISNAASLVFKNASGDGSSQIYNNGQSGKSELNLYGPDGVGVNTSNEMNTLRGFVDLAVKEGTSLDGTTNRGRFAVIGSSADASVAYSGFRTTSPVTSSTLWSLPPADGVNGTFLKTNGSANLTFTTDVTVSSVTTAQVHGAGLASMFVNSNNSFGLRSFTNGTNSGIGGHALIGDSTSGTSATGVEGIARGSGTNIGGYFSASGGTSDTGLLVAAGNTVISSITATAFNGTSSSTTVTGAGGFRNVYGITTGTITFSNDSTTQSTAYVKPGSCIQISTGGITTSSATAVTGSFVNTNLTATITPKAASSLIEITVSCEISNSGAGNVITLTVTRGSTNIGNGATGITAVNTPAIGYDTALALSVTDSPSTTSATVYTLQMKGSAGSTTLNDNTGRCSMILKEYAQ